MDKADQIVSNALASSATSRETTHKQLTFSADERDSIAYFFMRLQVIYGAEYDRQLPDEDAVRLAKRDTGREIMRFNREQIDRGIKYIREQQMSFSQGWDFMNLGRCAGAVVEANRQRAAHREHKALPNQRADKETGNAILAEMKAL